ncbi:phosphocholine-specific phospholipase C [Sphingobacterium faecale]|uniref:phospholipase C n=1 Tax=Sphingobacterium faecale TaxID=2803775 RepID=A0ABS1R8J0_9SPHI|nr:phospholipase C, phosphocholine-specific [Sphingobacterium faecale]MBL1410302.1 phospholipase C, phosphocholine-specific [Sphingobacterium faecale]
MESRRDFIRKAGLLAGSFGLINSLPQSIQAALKIDPTSGSTYLDAEHIVMVMQENRSFDHSYGSLRGVRGFNDPRALRLANGNPVWLQSYKDGRTYSPSRLDIKNSNAAWTQDLPHSWENQIGAWNHGRFDNWLESKRSGNKAYRDLPLTLGYYTREDIPFYYAFADAFTICDQHFCSSITGTTTNRHFFWTGKCIPEKGAKPLVRNSEVYFNKEAQWRTFPELLEKHKISWKVYQNEVSIQTALNGPAESWLGNFTDNNLEWFSQYKIRFKKSHIDFYNRRIQELPTEIEELKKELGNRNEQKLKQKIQQKEQQLVSFQREYASYNAEKFEALDDFTKSIHQRAFQTNEGDPNYHEIQTIDFEGQEITVPKGDVLHQFRSDVKKGQLPTVSWLVAPQYFSDHPSAPMYGAWYVSEILQILTENPEIWKKTIFLLNYDENDGYFDHVPPFVAPKPGDTTTGLCSPDLDYTTEYVTKEQELNYGIDPSYATEGPVGLGYRVPLVIASPWSRGGWVNSEVCDITSTIQFIEHFVQKKFNINLIEDNISSWRRGITGDLTSAFRTFYEDSNTMPDFLDRNQQILQINKAREKPAPNNFKKLTDSEINSIKQGTGKHLLPQQEKGTKPSNALPYELYTQEKTSKHLFCLDLEASNTYFGKKAAGAGFNIYAYGYKAARANWSFAVSAGTKVSYDWHLHNFEKDIYHLVLHGPNGYYREYRGDEISRTIVIEQSYAIASSELLLTIKNKSRQDLTLELVDHYENEKNKFIKIAPSNQHTVKISTKKAQRWYDVEIKCSSPLTTYNRRYAGRIENGEASTTDPLMGL